ncbi:MAG: ABC transporter substrate-binding protein [Sphaerochaetaceae bacterium]|nr:ABC transporter substrate-binding protein [Sphaerochaetaceae bacterium]
MKKLLFILMILLLVLLFPLMANGTKENQVTEKIIRVAEQIPGLITPGVWDGQAFSLNSSIYEYLVEVNVEDGRLDPVLALDWSTQDGKRWIIRLREGVRFHDGSEFDAKDVKFTIERTQDPAIGHLKRKDFAVVDTVEIIDDYTIAINLKESRPTFIYQMTDYNMAILADDYDYDKFGETHPMGTGPFKLQRLDPKESALLVRNLDYWNPQLPKVDKLALYFMADIEAKVSMLESGLVDIVPHVSPVIKRRLEEKKGFSVISPYQEQRFIAMAVDQKPFSDNRVRLAFKYSIDQKILARSVAQSELNNGFFYNEVPIMNMMAEYKDIPMRLRDIDRAKELLLEAGYPNGVSVDLYYSSDHPFEKELAQSVKELAAPAGFKINLKGFTRDVYLSQYWLKVPFSITGWGGRIDPSMLLALAFKTGAPWNESHLGEPYVDELIDKISLEPDFQTRVGYYHELQDWFYEYGPLINVQVPKLVALSDTIVDYRLPMTMLPQLKYTDKIE